MSSPSPPPDAVPVLAQTFEVRGPGALVVNVPGASTRIRPADGPDISVEISIDTPPGTSAETVLDRLRLSTRQMKSAIRITGGTPQNTDDWWRWLRSTTAALYLDLRVPSPIDADLYVPGGTLHAADVDGSFHCSGAGGSIALDDVSGTLTLQSKRTEVSLDSFSGDRLTAQVAAGTLSIRDTEADTVSIQTASAPLTVHGLEGNLDVNANGAPVTLASLTGPCTAHSHGAPLTYEGPLRADTMLTTVGAPLAACLATQTGACLTVEGSSLSVADAFSFDGTQEGQRITGRLNGGGPSLTLQAVRGTVSCKQMPDASS